MNRKRRRLKARDVAKLLKPSRWTWSVASEFDDKGLVRIGGCLPYPPSKNEYTKYWRGRVVLSDEGRAYKERVYGIFLERGKLFTALFHGEVSMAIEVYPPDHMQRDILNITESLADALEHCAYDNDYQIAHVKIDRMPVVEGDGKVVVDIQRA